MKKILIFLMVFFIVTSIDCMAQYQVNCISSTAASITLRSVGYAKNKEKALFDAELSAVKALLFYGVDNSQSSMPLMTVTETEAIKSYKDFFSDLYGGGYKEFISSSEIVKPFSKDINKRKNIVVDVTVNVRALREYMERNGIIRKFGF